MTEIAEYETITEGEATMQYSKSEAVFYNKVQVFNRDMSCHVIRLFAEIREKEYIAKVAEKKARRQAAGMETESPEFMWNKEYPGIHILDALAATGLRSVRYLKEIPGVSHVTINDIDEAATIQAAKNIKANNVDPSRATIKTGDATMLMYQHRDPSKEESFQYDVVDLDPYGTAVPFLDSAVQSVADGGLLIVTCTDASVLCGNYPEVCFAKYGSVSIPNSKYIHEMSLRILLHSIESAATKYKRYIVPWISLSVDFYVRVFVRVFTQPSQVKRSMTRQAYVLQSVQCPSYYIQPVGGYTDKRGFAPPQFQAPAICPETGEKMKMGGPIWSEPIHDQEIVDTLLDRVSHPTDKTKMPFPASTHARMKAVLTVISEELKDVPLYYTLPDLAATLRIHTPKYEQIRNALLNAGYRFSQAHHEATAVKTDAPPKVVWDIMRCYARDISPPLGSSNRKPSKTADAILANPIETEADFSEPKGVGRWKVHKETTRFPANPEEHWGPKRGAGRLIKDLQKAQDKEVGEEVDDDTVGKNGSVLKKSRND
jgi:tRNA (guanine26-N2/guanine27-N2)-dimethyltransferase